MIHTEFFLGSLFLRQILSSLLGPDTVDRFLLRYWLAFPTRGLLGLYAVTAAPVAFFHRPRHVEEARRHIVQLVGVGGEVSLLSTHRKIYSTRIRTSFEPGHVELANPTLDWHTIWKTIPRLPFSVRDSFFLFNHRLLYTRDRANRIDGTINPECDRERRNAVIAFAEPSANYFLDDPKRVRHRQKARFFRPSFLLTNRFLVLNILAQASGVAAAVAAANAPRRSNIRRVRFEPPNNISSQSRQRFKPEPIVSLNLHSIAWLQESDEPVVRGGEGGRSKIAGHRRGHRLSPTKATGMFVLRMLLLLGLYALGLNALEVTVCDCEQASQKGILQFSDENLYTEKREELKFPGYICARWKQIKHITTSFFGQKVVVPDKIALETSPLECLTMYESRRCNEQPMTINDNKFFYDLSYLGSEGWGGWVGMELNADMSPLPGTDQSSNYPELALGICVACVHLAGSEASSLAVASGLSISVAALRFDFNRLNRVSIGRQPIKEGRLPISLFVLFVPYLATQFRKGWNLYKKMQSPLDAKCGFVTDRYQVPFYQQIMASVNWAIQITFIRLSIGSQNTSNIRNIGYGRCLSFKVTLRVERNEFRCTIENYQSDRSAITIVHSVCPEPQSYVVRLDDGRYFRRTRWAINVDRGTQSQPRSRDSTAMFSYRVPTIVQSAQSATGCETSGPASGVAGSPVIEAPTPVRVGVPSSAEPATPSGRQSSNIGRVRTAASHGARQVRLFDAPLSPSVAPPPMSAGPSGDSGAASAREPFGTTRSGVRFGIAMPSTRK
ncbi:hypothetical protein DAPPUDRAFT_115033 [Daphnia pulex]|uniref:Uncharacterized protein n=1 Tax=Daphnia pulex TaxID=6669 RepID=E9HJZ9_DAPPU|nr:hypothetical protein DAPPUDRAFT_115033 [Daphnia pulex]|eukprot:EFX67904.1 hypothetical protein DAPPUDRAFT_115033 [Daphnia pulex]